MTRSYSVISIVLVLALFATIVLAVDKSNKADNVLEPNQFASTLSKAHAKHKVQASKHAPSPAETDAVATADAKARESKSTSKTHTSASATTTGGQQGAAAGSSTATSQQAGPGTTGSTTGPTNPGAGGGAGGGTPVVPPKKPPTAPSVSTAKSHKASATKADATKSKTLEPDGGTSKAKKNDGKTTKAKTTSGHQANVKNTRRTLKIRDDLPDYAKAAKLKLNSFIESGKTWPGQPDVMGCTPLECQEWCDECDGSITCQSKCFNNLYCRDECAVLLS